jgi:DNA-binding NarL/FixJ family response regulator
MEILIADDHLVVREGLRRLLSSVPDISVHEAKSTQAALTVFRARRTRWRLLIGDRRARILVFRMHPEPIYVMRALKRLDDSTRKLSSVNLRPAGTSSQIRKFFLGPALEKRQKTHKIATQTA